MFDFLKKLFQSKSQEHESIFLTDIEGLTDSSLAARNNKVWAEEVYFNYSNEELSAGNKNFLGLGVSSKTLLIFGIVVFLGVFILFTRAAYLQVWQGEHYAVLAEDNHIRVFFEPAPRGIIYDRRGVPLVANVPAFSVFIVPKEFKNSEMSITGLEEWLNEYIFLDEKDKVRVNNIKEITPSRKEYFEPMEVLSDIPTEIALKMRVESATVPGLSVEVTPRRQYIFGEMDERSLALSHVIGYEGKINADEYAELRSHGYLFNDLIGKTGIEATYEKQLRGRYGVEKVEIDASGNIVKILAKEPVRKGDNLYLALDFHIQAKLEQIMTEHLQKEEKHRAVGLIMQTQTGKILGFVSLPAYDNNLFTRGITSADYQKLIEDEDKPLFNRAVNGEYPSGSIFKPIVALAALEENIIDATTSFVSVGGLRISEWFFPDWKTGGHGVTDVTKALAESVNTFFYIIGGGHNDFVGLGVNKIKYYAELFGLNKLTGIDLPGERNGFLPDPNWKSEVKNEPWYIGDTYHLAIGQGDILVTPIQVLSYTAAFANGGTLYKPQLLDRYYDQDREKNIFVKPEVVNPRIASAENIEIVRSGMLRAAQSGSARILSSLPVRAAAKTGTAQWKTDSDPHAWMIAFAPYDNPELAMVILVEEGVEGSGIAARIAHQFLSWYFTVYN